MTEFDEWSPDEALGTETFEQGDDAYDEYARVSPGFAEGVELDPSLYPTLQIDHRELEEVGAELDDPETLVTLDGGMDDPDGLGEPASSSRARDADDGGWQLSAPLVHDDEVEANSPR